jgi:hypothetical protein
MAPIKHIGFDKAHFTLHSIVERDSNRERLFSIDIKNPHNMAVIGIFKRLNRHYITRIPG